MKCSATTAGCDFVEAYANMGLSELNLHDADRNVQGKLVRRNDGGVLSVQVRRNRVLTSATCFTIQC